MIDAHCHLQDCENIEKNIEGLEAVICCGSDIKSSKQAIQIAERFENVYATVGVHPESHDDPLEIENLIKFPKVVAVGECGLDSDNPQEEDLLKSQLELAQKYNLPLVVHNRKQDTKILKILGNYPKVMLHCFTSDMDFMKECVRRGWYISFGGIVTFKSSHELREVARMVPEDKLLIETDAPYLAPEPLRGTRNEPKNVKIVAEVLAKTKSVTFEKIDDITTKNAIQLFNIPLPA